MKHSGLYCTNGMRCNNERCTEQTQECRHGSLLRDIDDESSAVFSWETWAKQLNDEIATLRAENASLRESVAAKDGKIAGLKRDLGLAQIAINQKIVHIQSADARIEQLEWENKGIDEWRNEWEKVTQQLAAIQLYSKGLADGMREVLYSLQLANESPNGGINNTIWMMRGNETVFDAIDRLLSAPAPDLSENNHCEQVLHMVAAIQANAENKGE